MMSPGEASAPLAHSGLYPGLMRESWGLLDEPVRRFHRGDVEIEAVGTFHVRRGPNLLARLLARLTRLPPAAPAARVRVRVTPQTGGERWRRSFDGRPFVTTQSARPGSVLAERMGPLELRLSLTVVDGGLDYRTIGAKLGWGPAAVPLPLWIGPRVTARERPGDAPNQTRVAVEVRLPLLGLLLAYEGAVDLLEARSC